MVVVFTPLEGVASASHRIDKSRHLSDGNSFPPASEPADAMKSCTRSTCYVVQCRNEPEVQCALHEARVEQITLVAHE